MKKNYIKPVLETFEFEVEQGFAMSSIIDTTGTGNGGWHDNGHNGSQGNGQGGNGWKDEHGHGGNPHPAPASAGGYDPISAFKW